MDSSNVVQIITPITAPTQRNLTQGQEKEAEFLSLRLLNKRGRVRLSTHPIDYSRLPGKSCLLAVGNQKGCLAAAVRKEDGNFILLSTLSEFRTVVESGQPEPEPYIPFKPSQSLLRVPGTPNIIKFAFHDQRLMIGFVEGPILVYSTNDLYASTRPQLDPIHVFPGDVSTIPRDIVPNPGESPELVAILRGVHGQEPGHQVDVLDVQQLKHMIGWRKGSDINTAPVSISWSPKGKQIAIGLQSGDILSYSPLSTGSCKSHLPRPPSIPPTASSLLSTTWLTNASFHTIFSSPEASSSLFDASKSSSLTKTHVISTHDSKAQSTIDVELQDPCPPFGAQFPPGPLSIVLRNWLPAKFIIICGDGPSPDIGIIGSLSPDGSPDAWVSFTLEETSTPSLPLGEDTQDMALLGLEIDLTSSKSVRMSEQPDDGTPDLPPSPILYAYMSDGTVVAWHVLNTTGNTYPGMMTPNPTDASTSSTQLMTQQRTSMEESGMSSPRMSPLSSPKPASLAHSSQSQPTPAFGQTPLSPPSTSTFITPAQGFGAFGNVNTDSKFGSTGFGFAGGSVPSAFGTPSAPSAFGSSSFEGGSDAPKLPASPAFGSTAFGQTSTTPTFGAKIAAPAFGTTSFGSKLTAPAFGQSGFNSSNSSGSIPISSTGGFAAFASQGTSTFGAPVGSAFSTESNPTQSSPFGTAAPLSGPQSAFGAGGSGQATATPTSAFGAGGLGQATATPTSAFGAGGLGQATATPTSAFGAGSPGRATSFGQQQQRPVGSAVFGQTSATPAFGASSFGKPAAAPAFGQSGFSSSSSPKSSISSTGGFAAFANQGPSTFGPPVGSGFSSESKLAQSSPFGAAAPSPPQSTFEAGGSGQATTTPTSAFGTSGSGQATATPTSVFGATGSGRASATPTSAFGTGGFGPATPSGQQQQQQAPVQPSSASGSFGSKPATSTLGQTSFGTATASATLQGDTFGNFGTLGDSLKPPPLARFGSPSGSPPGSPPSPGESPPSSPKHPPSSQSIKLASSYIKPAEGFGAFIKPSGAFGAPGGSPKPVAQSLNIGQNSSFSLLSLSEAASQAGLSSTAQTSVESHTKRSNEGGSTEEESNAREGVEDATSEPLSLTDDGLDESASDKPSRSPTCSPSEGELEAPENIPLPETETPTPRSTPTPTPTPLPPPPKLSVSDVSLSLPTSSLPVSAVDKPKTTTPPGSPEKPAVPIPTPLAPKPLIPPSTVSPFGLGLGRPSSRPIRSSPLASAPITSTDEEDPTPEATPSKSAPAIVNVRPAESKTLLGQLSSSTQVPSTEPPVSSGNGTSSPTNLRPKTPPLLNMSPTPDAGPTTLRSPFVLGQPQALPVPLKASNLPVPLSVPTSVTHTPMSATREAKEDEAEEFPKHPLQIEFQRTYQEMVKELVQLHKKAQEMALIRPAISEPRGLDKLVLNERDFVPGKYSHGDLRSFAIMIGTLQKKVVPLLDQAEYNKGFLQDLQNLALISQTKQEELLRWARAREDPEFARTLKPRALGPEHSENQNRLRKALQIAHDRIQQCEDELESLKKRLEQHRSGKMGLTPPSLDTIDRTCRNIKVALEERTKLLEQLIGRIDALSPQTLQRLHSSPTHTRVPYQNQSTVTPPFASVAAAALNSERSLLKLKNALLSARKEPLFTTNVVKPKTTRTASLDPQVSPQVQRPEWKLPPVPPLNTPSSSVNRRSARQGKKHGAVQLKASPTGSDAKSIAFDWGPLPGVAPMDKLSQDVRSQKAIRSTKLTKQELDDDGEWEEDAEDYERH